PPERLDHLRHLLAVLDRALADGPRRAADLARLPGDALHVGGHEAPGHPRRQRGQAVLEAGVHQPHRLHRADEGGGHAAHGLRIDAEGPAAFVAVGPGPQLVGPRA
ncbi:MAG: hypothetical protein ACK559_16310, partial [bacterium]